MNPFRHKPTIPAKPLPPEIIQATFVSEEAKVIVPYKSKYFFDSPNIEATIEYEFPLSLVNFDRVDGSKHREIYPQPFNEEFTLTKDNYEKFLIDLKAVCEKWFDSKL